MVEQPPHKTDEEILEAVKVQFGKEIQKYVSDTHALDIAKTIQKHKDFITVGMNSAHLYFWDGTKWNFDTNRPTANRMLVYLHKDAINRYNVIPRTSNIIETFNTLVRMDIMTVEQDYFDKPNLNLVFFKNGVYDLTQKKLLRHNPKYRNQMTLNCDYNPNAECPMFRRFIKEAMPDKET